MAIVSDQKMQVHEFSEGFSNFTYHLVIGDWEGVLRRAPSGYVPPKAHDMKREYDILTKVHPIFSLAPKTYLYANDRLYMDKEFYVMEKKNGVVIDGVLPANFNNSKEVKKNISEAVINTLVTLHQINYKASDLETIGKPEGFLERQVYGWITRYGHAKIHEIEHVTVIEKWLIENIPLNNETTIIHNDFKLNNMVFDTEDPTKVTGILDWELSTIGDPLCDLGSTLVYWGEIDDPYIGIRILTGEEGFLTRKEMLELYMFKSGREIQHIDYYLTFGFYKLAAIQQQLFHRWSIGEIKDDRLELLEDSVTNLMQLAYKSMSGNLLK